ncbi:MAG: hypothetical protein Q8M16_14180 [Pirellulaceae bacterium]|nr:hypothetical protein [Pirellulaceae bacterium]
MSGLAGFSGFVAIVWLVSLGCQPNEQPKQADGPGLQLPNEHGLVTVEWLKSAMDRQQPSEKYSQPNATLANPTATDPHTTQRMSKQTTKQNRS